MCEMDAKSWSTVHRHYRHEFDFRDFVDWFCDYVSFAKSDG